MKTIALFLLSALLVTSVFAGSPTITVKKKSKIKVDTDFNYGSSLAFNTTTGETLFSSNQDWNGALFGALISPKGKLVAKTFPLPEYTNEFAGDSIAYNPVLQEYLLAYTPWLAGTLDSYTQSILAVRLDRHANRIGQEFTVLKDVNPPKPNGLGDNAYPHLVFDPNTNGYIMVWERTEGIAAALLDKNGKVTSPIKIIKKNPGPNGFYDDQGGGPGRIQDVQWLASGKKLVVLFDQRLNNNPPNEQADYWVAFLDPLLKKAAKVSKVNTSPMTFHKGAEDKASLGILPDDTGCVFYETDNGVEGQKIMYSKGKFSSTPIPVFSKSTVKDALGEPIVAFSATSTGTIGLLIANGGGVYGVVPTNVWAQALDDQCRPVGQPKIVDQILEPAESQALFALPRNPSDKLFEFIWTKLRGNDNGTKYYLKSKLQVTP